jgi:DNA repair protein RadC
MSRRFKAGDQPGYYIANGPVSSEEILKMARTLLNRRFARGRVIGAPEEAKAFVAMKLGHLEHEVFAALFLDNRHRVLRFETLFRGTIDGASVHPREVVKRVLELNAAAVIFAHNPPSGLAEPSQADLRITQRLKDALALVDVRVLDHFIVGSEVVSFAERGLV